MKPTDTLSQPAELQQAPVWQTAPDIQFNPADIAKFKSGAASNRKFWSRFGVQPDFQGATVLDVGCGWGALCVEMAQAGAAKVVGLDIVPRLIDFAQGYTQQHYPEFKDVLEFRALDLRDYAPVQFDIIVSKDSFEHILDLDRMLQEMYKRLKPGGRIYTGFGPLYPSPYGDHDRRQVSFARWGAWGKLLARLPWAHLWTEQQIIAMHRRTQENSVTSMRDLGLNQLAASDYRRAFARSGFQIVNYQINQSEHFSSKLFAALAKLPGLEDYVTHNIYCILEKPLHANVPRADASPPAPRPA